MAIRTVAIVGTGDMGHAVGRALRAHGLDVATCLDGRSERTRRLAAAAAIRDVPSLETLLQAADVVLSIVVPAAALPLAEQVATAARAVGFQGVFADCNAISPTTARAVEGALAGAGVRFVDASIIGGPPGPRSVPRFYASGAHDHVLAELDGMGITVCPIGGGIGRASALKMCYGGLTKATTALHAAVLTAAAVLGVADELRAELTASQAAAYASMEANVPSAPVSAHRWIGEMEEVAGTFEQAGVTPLLHRGAADVFRLLGATAFARETPESVDPARTLEATIRALALIVQEGAATRSDAQ